MLARILIGVDSSAPAQRAVQMGWGLAASTGAAVRLIHVIHPPAGFIEGVFMKDAAEAEAAALLKTLKRHAPAGVTCDHVIATGIPADEISRAAREWGADLVVVGDHNRHVLSRFLLGSVADGVVRHAPCPVLVVRAKDSERAERRRAVAVHSSSGG